jgi:hypothetical protein
MPRTPRRTRHGVGGGLSMFEAFGNHAEGVSLYTRDSLITVGTVAHDAG